MIMMIFWWRWWWRHSYPSALASSCNLPHVLFQSVLFVSLPSSTSFISFVKQQNSTIIAQMWISSPQKSIVLHHVHFRVSLHGIADFRATKISRRSTMNNDFKAWSVGPAGLVKVIHSVHALFLRPLPWIKVIAFFWKHDGGVQTQAQDAAC